jgi:hypothetical protein
LQIFFFIRLQICDVSDSHCVASHPVCPSRARPVYVTSPMLAQCTVTDADPVPVQLCRRITLKAPTSTDHTCVTLPPRSPTVIVTRRVPLAPCVDISQCICGVFHFISS